jgi:hypothetical protein
VENQSAQPAPAVFRSPGRGERLRSAAIPLDTLRKSFYAACYRTIPAFEPVFSRTLPAGCGKSLRGLISLLSPPGQVPGQGEKIKGKKPSLRLHLRTNFYPGRYFLRPKIPALQPFFPHPSKHHPLLDKAQLPVDGELAVPTASIPALAVKTEDSKFWFLARWRATNIGLWSCGTDFLRHGPIIPHWL